MEKFTIKSKHSIEGCQDINASPEELHRATIEENILDEVAERLRPAVVSIADKAVLNVKTDKKFHHVESTVFVNIQHHIEPTELCESYLDFYLFISNYQLRTPHTLTKTDIKKLFQDFTLTRK